MFVTPQPMIRRASVEDAKFIALAATMAGDGTPNFIWKYMHENPQFYDHDPAHPPVAEPSELQKALFEALHPEIAALEGVNQYSLALGLQHASKDSGIASYTHASLELDETGTHVRGVTVGYLESDDPDFVSPPTPNPANPNPVDVFCVPFIDLEKHLTVNTYYIYVVAVFPEFRRLGVATRLLEHAIERAKELEAHNMALMVADHKPGAQALYRSMGFQERARAPYVNFEGRGETDQKEWILMMRDLEDE